MQIHVLWICIFFSTVTSCGTLSRCSIGVFMKRLFEPPVKALSLDKPAHGQFLEQPNGGSYET